MPVIPAFRIRGQKGYGFHACLGHTVSSRPGKATIGRPCHKTINNTKKKKIKRMTIALEMGVHTS